MITEGHHFYDKLLLINGSNSFLEGPFPRYSAMLQSD